MKRVKRFGEFLNESQEINERIDWEAIPILGGWIKARRERKEAEAKAKAEAYEKELDAHNQKMLKIIASDYYAYSKQIEKNFKDYPDLKEDKLLYLQHFIWASLQEEGWSVEILKKFHKSGKFEAEFKRVMTHATNPRGASWPGWVWYEDLEPDLDGIGTDITFAKGYAKEFK